MRSDLTEPRCEDTRFTQARLQLVIDTLPATTYFNPIGVAVVALALYAGRAEFGNLPVANMFAAVCVHVLSSICVFAAWWRHRKVLLQDTAMANWELLIIQAVIGLSWGAAGWLLWVEGNAANNIFIIMMMTMAAWAMALTRCSSPRVYLAGILALSVPYAVLFATSDGAAAHVGLAAYPLWVWYMVFTGIAANRRVEEMLKARFANEDLGKELEAARDEAVRKRLEAEAANHSKTAFLANMSHELRTPLNAIIGFSEIISTQALGPNHARYPEYANDVLISGTHLLALINDVLDVAKIEAGKMEITPKPLDVGAVFASVERIMEIRAREKNLRLKFTLADAATQLIADERAFRQILLNLLSNAVKFTPEGGSIDVKCRPAEYGGMLLSVEDTGPGIAPEHLNRLFKPFTQVDNRFDRNHGGTGLGLALVRGLAELHDGHAWIESEMGQGTRAFVYFPLVEVKREPTRATQ
jgi:two-component system cell cycle sensor histidine kinase PleC